MLKDVVEGKNAGKFAKIAVSEAGMSLLDDTLSRTMEKKWKIPENWGGKWKKPKHSRNIFN